MLVGQKNLSGVKAVKDGASAYLKNTPPEDVSGINRHEALLRMADAAESQLISTSKQDAEQAERNAASAVTRLVDTVLQDAVIQLTRPENLPPEVLDSKPGVVFKAAFDSLRDRLPEDVQRILTSGSKAEQDAANESLAKGAHAIVEAQTKQRNIANQQKANQFRIDTATDKLKGGDIEGAFGGLYQNELDPLTPAAASSALSAAALQVFPPGKLNQEHLRLATLFAESGIPSLKKVGDEAIQRAERDFAQEEIDYRYPAGEYRLNEDMIVTDKQGKILNDPDIQKGWGNKFTNIGEARDWWMEFRGMQKDANGDWPKLGPLSNSYKRFITEVQSDIERTNSNAMSSILRIAKDPLIKADSKTRWKASGLKALLDEDKISSLSIEAATGLLQSEVQLLADTPPEMLTAIKTAVADSNNATFATAFFRVYDPGSFPNVAEAIGSSSAFKVAHQASILYTTYSEQGTLTREQIMTKVADFSKSQQEKSDTNRLPVPTALQDKLDATKVGVVTDVTSHFNVKYENLNWQDQGLMTDFADMSSSIPDLPAADRAKFVIRMMSSVGYVSLNRADGLSDIVYNPQTNNGRALPSTEDIKSAEFSIYLASLAPAVATYMSKLKVIDTGVIKTVAISPDMIRSIEPAPTDFYTSRGFSPVRVTMKSGEVYEIDPEQSGISVTEAKYRNYLSTPEFPTALKKYNSSNSGYIYQGYR
jgi:predicted transcriptional regulator